MNNFIDQYKDRILRNITAKKLQILSNTNKNIGYYALNRHNFKMQTHINKYSGYSKNR